VAIFNSPINTFASGEFSPRAHGRSDIPQYQQGAAEITNFVARPHGVEKRMGTLFQEFTGALAADTTFLNALKDETYQYRVIPYEYSGGARTILVIAANTGTSSAGVFAGYAEVSTSNTFVSYAKSSVFTGYVLGRAITVAQVEAMTWAQVGDVLFIQLPGHPTLVFRYVSAGSYTLYLQENTSLPNTALDQYLDAGTGRYSRVPFLPINVLNNFGNGTLTISATSGTVTMTSSTSIFLSTHIGARFLLHSGTATYRCYVTLYNNASSVLVQMEDTADSTTAFGNSTTRSWQEQAWSDARGWPTAIAYYQQRLYRADATGMCRASQQGNLTLVSETRAQGDPDYGDAITNDRPFSYQVADTRVAKANWLMGGKSLLKGTTDTEFTVSSKDGSIGPLDLQVSPDSQYGSEATQAVRLGNAVYFVGRGGKVIRELVFNFDENTYKASDITILVDHLNTKRASSGYYSPLLKFRRLAVDTQRGILWAVSGDGGLHSCSINRDIQMAAWSSHILGGAYTAASVPVDQKPYVNDVMTMKNSDGNVDVWLSVTRTINGSTSAYIEKMPVLFDEVTLGGAGGVYPVFLDSTKVYTGGPYTTLTGLSHLEGQSVAVVADGVYVGDFTVASGIATLGGSYGNVYALAGLKYTARVKTLDLEAGSPIGTSMGLKKKINRVTVRLYRTVGLSVGVNDNTERDPLLFRDESMGAGRITMFTGDKSIEPPLGFSDSAQLILETSDPFPCTIAGVFVQGVTNV